MTLKYTAISSSPIVVSTELNTQVITTTSAGPVLSTTEFLNNDASTGRLLLVNFEVFLNAQTTRTGSPQVSLIIVPAVDASIYPDIGNLRLATPYIAKTLAGVSVVWLLDPVTNSRILTVTGVVLPNAKFKLGLINETTQSFASTGNTIKMSTTYSYADE